MTKNPSDSTTSNAIQSIIAHLTPFIAHTFQVGALTKANRPRLQNFQKAYINNTVKPMLKINNIGAATINIASATETKVYKSQHTNINGRKNNKNILAKAILNPPITLFFHNRREQI